MFYNAKLGRLDMDKHTSLLDPYNSYGKVEVLWILPCKIFLATLALGSSNPDQPFQVTTLVPKLAKPFGTAPPTLILDRVFLIRIDSHVVLFINVYLLKYSYSETRLGRVNKSFNIIRPMFLP